MGFYINLWRELVRIFWCLLAKCILLQPAKLSTEHQSIDGRRALSCPSNPMVAIRTGHAFVQELNELNPIDGVKNKTDDADTKEGFKCFKRCVWAPTETLSCGLVDGWQDSRTPGWTLQGTDTDETVKGCAPRPRTHTHTQPQPKRGIVRTLFNPFVREYGYATLNWNLIKFTIQRDSLSTETMWG